MGIACVRPLLASASLDTLRLGKPGLCFGQNGGSLSTIAVVDRYEKAFGSVSEAHNLLESLQT
jgi:hypothetical protein